VIWSRDCPKTIRELWPIDQTFDESRIQCTQTLVTREVLLINKQPCSHSSWTVNSYSVRQEMLWFWGISKYKVFTKAYYLSQFLASSIQFTALQNAHLRSCWILYSHLLLGLCKFSNNNSVCISPRLLLSVPDLITIRIGEEYSPPFPMLTNYEDIHKTVWYVPLVFNVCQVQISFLAFCSDINMFFPLEEGPTVTPRQSNRVNYSYVLVSGTIYEEKRVLNWTIASIFYISSTLKSITNISSVCC
jgi:hypothetical protein